MHKKLFGVRVVQMIVLVLTTQLGYCHSTIEDTYTSGVLDLFLPLKNSGKALLSMAWTLQRKKETLSKNTEYKISNTINRNDTVTSRDL